MTKSRTITLGGQTFTVPPLVIVYNREVYPICARITAGDMVDRWIASGGMMRLDDQDMADLMEIAFHLVQASGAALDRAAVEALPINPIELLNMFFTARVLTGVWADTDGPAPGGDAAGEAKGARRPRAKTRRT